ncbi:PepSY-associated TM helix domain-containing protein [Limibacter armeniacum]|uniref:PepSY-associated TM helix domain-containing protein n=1 Tax=Limibacter armeniacum TaxID=466084 RepID=UPI002FE5D374
MRSFNTRQVFRLIHLFIGLTSGLIVFIEAVTGAIWVFNEEISSLLKEDITVEMKDAPKLSPTEAVAFAKNELPNRAVHGILYSNEAKPIEVIFYEAEPEFYYSIYLDPYSGKVIDRKNHKDSFFSFVLDGHLHLWLPPKIGTPIVSYGTLLFLFSIITGIVLWWPKNRKGRRQRLKLDWKPSTRWRRKNFDLHTVLGFYVSALALVFAITGLVMALNWFYVLFYSSIGGDKETAFIIPKNTSEKIPSENQLKPIDQLPDFLEKQYPTAKDYEIHFPYADSVSIYVEVSYQDGIYSDADYLFFDQYTLEDVSTPSVYGKYQDASFQDHLIRMNYDIHVGAILGLPTKVLAFLTSLLIATLPITGLVIYLGRKKKQKQRISTY